MLKVNSPQNRILLQIVIEYFSYIISSDSNSEDKEKGGANISGI
jgi:hypothetical protein